MSNVTFGRRAGTERAPARKPAAARIAVPDAVPAGRVGGSATSTAIMLAGILVAAVAGFAGRPLLEPLIGGEPRTGQPRTATAAVGGNSPASEESRIGAAARGDKQKLAQAAESFFGFYHVNTRVRAMHCAQFGVDLGRFVSSFAGNHREVYGRAVEAARLAGMSEDAMWAASKDRLMEMNRTDMASVESQLQVDGRGACETFRDYGDNFLPHLMFEKVHPESYALLMGE